MIGLYIYRQAFQYFDFGYAAALSWVLFVFIMIITAVQFVLAERWVYYDGEFEDSDERLRPARGPLSATNPEVRVLGGLADLRRHAGAGFIVFLLRPLDAQHRLKTSDEVFTFPPTLLPDSPPWQTSSTARRSSRSTPSC